MAENKNWEIYFRLLCESRKATKESAIYWVIMDNYTFQLLQKLMSTVVDENASQKKRESAALFVLQEMIHVCDEAVSLGIGAIELYYTDIDMPYLELLRRTAIDLMTGNERNSVLQMCGEHMATVLVDSWLEMDDEAEQKWDGFLEFVEEGFTAPSSAHFLDIFLSIFRALPPDHRDALMLMMEPRITRNRAQFEAALLRLLRDARDESPFLILPCIILTFNQPLPPAILQGAIMSDLFINRTSYGNGYMLQIAIILRYCVQHTKPFQLSKDACKRLKFIILEIAQLTNSRAALQLYEAFRFKFYEYNPSQWCRPEWEE